MGQHHRSTSPQLVLLAALLLLAATTATEARFLRRIRPRSLFDVTAACGLASFPRICESLVQSATATTTKSLTEAAIKKATSKAKEAEAIAAELMATPGTDKMVKSSLDVCRECFGSAVDSLQAAAKNLKEAASHADLMNDLSAAVTFVGTCDDAFSERPGLVSPVSHINANLQKLVSNCLDLAAGLKKN